MNSNFPSEKKLLALKLLDFLFLFFVSFLFGLVFKQRKTGLELPMINLLVDLLGQLL